MDEGPRRPPTLRERAQASPYPPFGVTAARGLRAAGSSPLVLAVAFLSALAVWGLYSSLGPPPPPAIMTFLIALPPIHVYFDAQLLATAVEGTLPAVSVAAGVIAGRALLFGLLTLLVVDVVRDGRPDVRGALRRLPRTAGTLVLIFAIEFALVLGVPLVVQTIGGPGLGFFGVLAALVFGLVFMVMAPVVAAAEGAGPQEALRRGYRAARLPGGRHFVLSMAYFFFVYWAASVTPSGFLVPATPSLVTWVFVLVATLVQAGALGAFAFRWMIVRDHVPVGPARAPGGGRAGTRGARARR